MPIILTDTITSDTSNNRPDVSVQLSNLAGGKLDILSRGPLPINDIKEWK